LQKSTKNFKSFIYLLSSMRFAITMLSFIGIASIIGTVLKQNESYENYIIKFGQFWFDIFEIIGLYNVYQAFWFLLILIFLVISTSLCVFRNTPTILKGYRKFQDRIQEKSLLAFKHSYNISYDKFNVDKVEKLLAKNKFKFKKKIMNNGDELIVAKKGDFQKLGYIFTHLAIIVISVGGIMDGNLGFKIQELLGIKNIILVDMPLNKIPNNNRLQESNFSYRAQMLIAEGEKQEVAVLRVKEGYLIQELPFTIILKDFRIKHYSTGQPKSFESDLVVRNKKTGVSVSRTISVNKPLTVDGITIYQSDFQDGGSKLDLLVWNLHTNEPALTMASEVFKKNQLVYEHQKYTIEFEDFRLFNILEIGKREQQKPTNVGPSFRYKIRNDSGQAIEYQTYQYPMLVDESSFFMSGMRNTPQEEFRYLKIPADSNYELKGFITLKSLMTSPRKIGDAINKVIKKSFLSQNQDSHIFKESVTKIVDNFLKGGYNQIAKLINESIPLESQEEAANSYIKIIFLVTKEVIQAYQLEHPDDDLFLFDDISIFIQNALNAYSDSFFYGTPVFFELKDYEHIQASGLQLTKSPGQVWVYIGSLLLVIGIFCMIYIQEVRLWILRKKHTKGLIISLTTNRYHYEFDQYATNLKDKIKRTLS